MLKKIIEAIKNFRVKRGETNMDENQKKAVNYTDIVYLKQYLDQNFSKNDHNHDDQYAPLNHNHDGQYAPVNHNHDDKYADKALTELELKKILFRLYYRESNWNELSRRDLVIYKEQEMGQDKYLYVSFPDIIFPDFGGQRIVELYDKGSLETSSRIDGQERDIKSKEYYTMNYNLYKFVDGEGTNGTWEPATYNDFLNESTTGVIRFDFTNGGDVEINHFLTHANYPRMLLKHSAPTL